MSNVTRESCHTHAWVHVTYIRESCHMTDSHTWHDSSKWFRCCHESYHTCAWVTVHICASHVTPVHQPCHTHESGWMCHIFFFSGLLVWSAVMPKKRQTWLIYHMIDLSNLWYTCLMNESCHAWVMSNTCVGHVAWPWLIHTSDVTHSSLISVVST